MSNTLSYKNFKISVFPFSIIY